MLKAEGLDQIVLKQLGLPHTRSAHGSLGGAGRSHQESDRRPDDPRRRQVHGLRGLVQEPERGGVSRRLRAPPEGAPALGRGRGARTRRRKRAARRRGRHPGARRLRIARHARHDEGGRVRARARRALLRHLLWLPVGHRGVRPQRLRPRRRGLDRGGRERAAQGDLQAARSARRRRTRRHDAPGPLRVRAAPRDRSRQRVYGSSLIHERHRHRFEFNCLYENELAEKGMRVSGRSPDGKFVEIAETAVASLVRGRAVPSGVPVPAAPAAPAVCELRRGGLPAQDRASWNSASACQQLTPHRSGRPC